MLQYVQLSKVKVKKSNVIEVQHRYAIATASHTAVSALILFLLSACKKALIKPSLMKSPHEKSERT